MLVGDVVICPSVAHRNAPDHAGSYDYEMALLLVHGILHLTGMDHVDEDEAVAMESREKELLDRFHRGVQSGAGEQPAQRQKTVEPGGAPG